MILVDTSVWIDFLRDRDTPGTRALNGILDRDYPFGITGIIYQEILQGADSPESLHVLIDYFATQRFYHPLDNVDTYRRAAEIYGRRRRNGVTIRSAVDCLIAQIAVEHNLFLLHSDRDFQLMKDCIPGLREWSND
ncbi:PIN domain nuclease [Nitrosococcus wardiae]|uniref:Ribonuclease VapC n=1 Tax=Nitrosococcus wardiae TaxID=1814290 RepID=A0A4P7C545_9GAMM|nr:PIN domain nuclease [Nitrosococcus wardiae]QBQ55952.1 PIN domain nuclease [Nitrosococcus wardiae]